MRLASLYMFALFVLGGCSALPTKSPEEIVIERAQQRIDLLMAGDYQASYEFTTPGYRSTESVGRYGTRWSGVGMWISANVIKAECTAAELIDRCKAAVQVVYRAVGYDPLTTILTEDWILIDDNWYLYQNLSE